MKPRDKWGPADELADGITKGGIAAIVVVGLLLLAAWINNWLGGIGQ